MASEFDPNTAKPIDEKRNDGVFDPSTAAPIKSQNKGFGGDVATALKRGVQQLPGVVTGLADIPAGLAGIDRPFGRAADALGELTGFQPGKWAKGAEKEFSPQTQAGRAEIDQAWNDPSTGAADIAGAYLRNPRTTALSAIESVPAMLAGGVAGKGIGVLGGLASAPARAAIGEGLTMAGTAMDQTDQAVDPQKAAAAALATGAVGGAIGYAGGKVAGKLGITDLDMLVTGGTKGAATTAMPIYKRIPAGMLQEGLIEEAPQSAFETASQNWAEGKPLTEGLARNVTEGALAGGLMGGVGGALPQRVASQVVQHRQPQATPDEQVAQANAQQTASDALASLNQNRLATVQSEETPAGDIAPASAPDGAAALRRQNVEQALQREAAARMEAERVASGYYNPDDEILSSTGAYQKPSEAMGLDPSAGALTAVAAMAVDTGASLSSRLAPTNDLMQAAREREQAGAGDVALSTTDRFNSPGRPNAQTQAQGGGQKRSIVVDGSRQPAGADQAATAIPAQPDARTADQAGSVRAGGLGQPVQPAAGTGAGGVPGAVTTESVTNATISQAAQQAPAAPAAAVGLPGTAAAPVQASGVSDFDKSKEIIKSAMARMADAKKRKSKAAPNSIEYGEAYLDEQLAWVDVAKANILGFQFKSGPEYDKRIANLSAVEAQAEKTKQTLDAIRKAKPQGTIANVPQPAQPGTQASQAPSAQGAAPAGQAVATQQLTATPATKPTPTLPPVKAPASMAPDSSASTTQGERNGQGQETLLSGATIAAPTSAAVAPVTTGWGYQFGSAIQARQFVSKNGLKNTHAVTKSGDGRQWLVVPIQPTQDQVNGTQAPEAVQAETQGQQATAATIVAPEQKPITRAQAVDDGPAIVLQNRDRSSAASIAQMNEIAAKPDYLRAGQSSVMDSGAPVVFGQQPASAVIGKKQTIADGKGQRTEIQYAVVEADDLIPSHSADGLARTEYANGVAGKLRAVAGNARTAGITEGYRRNTAGQYRADLEGDAQSLGLDVDAVRKMKAPVLVRIMSEKDVTADIGDRSNIANASRLSAVEQAATDARRLYLSGLEFADTGEPTPAAIMQFVRSMPTSEQSELIGPDGAPTRQAIDRLMAAIFKQAYGADELVSLYAQATDQEARNILNGMAGAAGPMAALKDAGEYDIRGAVAEAAGFAVNARRAGQKLSDMLKTPDMMMSDEALVVARFFANNPRSAKAVADGLRNGAEAALAQVEIERANQQQGGMFGDQPTQSRESIFRSLNGNQEIIPQDRVQRAAGTEVPGPGVERPSEPAGRGAEAPGGAAQAEGAAEQGLTAPTREDIEAQQDRADNADSLAQREQIDREASNQTLTQPSAPEQRTDNSGDMFALEKAQAEIDKRNAGIETKKDPNQPGMFDAADVAEPQARYEPPSTTPFADWKDNGKGPEHPDFQPTARQRVIMDAVANALDAGVFYTADLNPRVAKDLGYDGPTGDGSGKFSMDVYLARKAVEAQRATASMKAVAKELSLATNDALGTLVFNDGKVIHKASVGPISDDGLSMRIAGQRGVARVFMETTPDAIKRAIERAHERGKRKDSYAEFIASRQAQIEGRLIDEKQPATTAKTEPSTATVEDFGEKLPPARRAIARQLSEDLSNDDIARLPLSQVWPASEIDAIDDPFVAAAASVMRDAIPAKPRTAYKVKAWAQKVQLLRSTTAMLVSGKVTRERFTEKMGEAYALRNLLSKIKLLEQIDRTQWSRIGDVQEWPKATTYDKDGKQIAVPQVVVEIDGKRHHLEKSGDLNDHMDAITALLSGEAKEKRMAFEIRGSGNSFFINKTGDKQYRHLMEFTSVKDARDALENRYKDVVAAWEAVKARDNITERDLRSEVNRERTGQDWRQGKDVTAEEFQQQFGFRGGEFGKWVAQGKGAQERQFMLNSAYDALMDLSNILGIPPRAVSLEGSLGIAFGSRGSGWASAHFEPSNLVINLTKPRGAGALAHEWFHALDNYFARKRNDGKEVQIKAGMNAQQAYRDSNYVTHRTTPMMVRKDGRGSPVTKERLAEWRKSDPSSAYLDASNWIEDPRHKQGVRAEVEERFDNLVKTLNASPMSKRARLLDGVKEHGDGYWSRTLERAARSFENYIQSRMLEQGYHNDFLANVREAAETKKSLDRYPYLMPSEVAPIADAFTSLFDTIQTRETGDGKVVLYEPSQSYNDGYETDLFGEPVQKPAGKNRQAKPTGPAVSGNVQPAAGVQDTPATRGYYQVNTFVGQGATRELGASRITSAAQAATATKYLYKSAVERFDGIVTDKDGKPLAVVGGFKGAVSETSVYPATIMAEAIRIPGAANIWFSHNHPSGRAELSQADYRINAELHDVFDGSGIKPMGLLAVTRNGYDYVFGQDMKSTEKGFINDPTSALAVPVVERELSDNRTVPEPITGPLGAKSVARTFYGQAKEPGIIMLDSQMNIAAWVPLTPEMMGPLRNTGGLAALYRAISQSNASRAVIVHGGELDYAQGFKYSNVSYSENIAAALKKAGAVPMDSINAVTGRSVAESGMPVENGPVFSRAAERNDTTGFYSALAREIDALPTKAAPAPGWQMAIQGMVKNGKVKADELEWSGLTDWLKLQTGKVTKEQITGYLDANGVQVQEVVLGAPMGGKELDDRLEDWASARIEEDRGNVVAKAILRGDSWDKLRHIMKTHPAPEVQALLDRHDSPTKYDKYTLPGGENYREVLLTLPAGSIMQGVLERSASGEMLIRWADGVGEYLGTKNRVDAQRILDSKTQDTAYKSPHWDQPNVLAHIRVNDRADADGKRVLFVEEIQSDLQQDYRRSVKRITDAVESDFHGIVDRMKKAGVLEVECD